MKNITKIIGFAALIATLGACHDQEINNQQNNNKPAEEKPSKPVKPVDNNTDDTNTEDANTEDANTEQENKDNPLCTTKDFTGCQNYKNSEWVVQCYKGQVEAAIKCYDYEICVQDEDQIYCKEGIPQELQNACIGKPETVFCQKVGNNDWLVVCDENSQVYDGMYGTENCSSSEKSCGTADGVVTCYECQSTDDCPQGGENEIAVCLYGNCSTKCLDNYEYDFDHKCVRTAPDIPTFTETFDFIKNPSNSYTDSYTDVTADYTVIATGRANLVNIYKQGDDTVTDDYTIDGAGIVINTSKNEKSQIIVSDQQVGIGAIKFDTKCWADNANITVILTNGQQNSSKMFKIYHNKDATISHKFLDAKATGFVIKSTGRAVIDNLSWTTDTNSDDYI